MDTFGMSRSERVNKCMHEQMNEFQKLSNYLLINSLTLGHESRKIVFLCAG